MRSTHLDPTHTRLPSCHAACVDDAIARIRACGRPTVAFISEVCPCVGGQIVPSPGHDHRAHAAAGAAGGVRIADDVQMGPGRKDPHDNALKIRPPLCFTMQDADFLLDRLARILRESGSQPKPN